jgi:hypothetical protein
VATREAPTAEASAIPGPASDGISIAAPMTKAAAFAACPDGKDELQGIRRSRLRTGTST